MSMETEKSGYVLPETAHLLSSDASEARAAALAANSTSHLLPSPRGVVDQDGVPCCVSCALGAAMEALKPDWPPLSPLFHYYVTKYDSSGTDPDGSLALVTGLAILASQGICLHALHAWPYTMESTVRKPSPEAYEDGKARSIERRGLQPRYRQCPVGSRVVWIRDQLEQGRPVIVGLRLLDTYPDSFLDGNFEWKDPRPEGTSLLGGHCVAVLGYDDAREAVLIQDSRGEGSFDGGRWWMGYAVVDSDIVQEAYSLLPGE